MHTIDLQIKLLIQMAFVSRKIYSENLLFPLRTQYIAVQNKDLTKLETRQNGETIFWKPNLS